MTQTVNYTYNTLGQLTKLTDGSNNLIVSYTYNNVGELTREDKGDGTYSTDTYDKDGQSPRPGQLCGERHRRQQLHLHVQRAGPGDEHGDDRRHLDLQLRQCR